MCVLVCSDEMGTVASVLLETANMSRVVKLLITHVQVAITRVCCVYGCAYLCHVFRSETGLI